MTSQRTDIHRPSAPEFDPQKYVVRGIFDTHPSFGSNLSGTTRQAAVSALVDKGYRFGHGSSSQCGHCGAHIRYAALLAHPESETFIFVGETCLDTRFSATKAEFRALRNRAALAAQAARNEETRAQNFADHLAAAVASHPTLEMLGDRDRSEGYGGFVADIREQLYKRPLTDRQKDAAAKAIERTDTYRARRAKERAESVPAPEGKVTISGTIRRVKTQPNPFSPYGGDIMKMTVRDDRGFSVHCTIPSSLTAVTSGATTDGLNGQRVTFTATLTRSDDDATFAFGKRPTKAALAAA